MRCRRAGLGGRVLLVAVLGGCAGAQEGPPVELADIAVPKVVSDAAKSPPPAPPLALSVHRDGFRAWIPRVVSPNGDVIEGHYVEVSDKAPTKELTPPDYLIPKAPKQIYRPPVKREAVSTPSQAPLVSRPSSLPVPGSPIPPASLETPYDLVQP